MANCEKCYHNKVCINGANHKNAESCINFKDKDLIAELPCKVGSTVFILIDELKKFGGPYIKEEKVVEISTTGRIWTYGCCYDDDDIGKMLFFTREEAKAVLKERENSVKTMTLDNLIKKYETESAELLKVGAVEPAEEKQLIADLLKELKEYRNEKRRI
jgi:hypothetical protein